MQELIEPRVRPASVERPVGVAQHDDPDLTSGKLSPRWVPAPK
jgi:hypothetical protein